MNKNNRDKKLISEIKKQVIDGLPKAVADTVLKLVTYTLPILVWSFVVSWLLNPPINIQSMQIDVLSDKMVLSEENDVSQLGKESTISDVGQGSTLVLSDLYSYYAPEIQIKVGGYGKIRAAYIIYEQNSVDNSGVLMPQKIPRSQDWRTHFRYIPLKYNATCNYVNRPNESTKILYFVLIGEDNTKHISCIYIDMNDKNIEEMALEKVYELTPNSQSVFGANKDNIQEDIEKIGKMNLF